MALELEMMSVSTRTDQYIKILNKYIEILLNLISVCFF